MAQFDVYKNPRKGPYPLLLDVQPDVLTRLATRVVVPMMTRKRFGATPITRLNPVVKLAGTDYVALFQELAAVPVTALGSRSVTSLRARRADFVAALDLLITGL